MENTNENKEKFFAQYWGQQVLSFKGDTSSHKGMIVSKTIKPELGNFYLELTPLSMISDEDAIEVANLMQLKSDEYFNQNHRGFDRVSYAKQIINNGDYLHYGGMCRQIVLVNDLLRSKGYALPYLGLSVEKQIDYGWIKLKTE